MSAKKFLLKVNTRNSRKSVSAISTGDFEQVNVCRYPGHLTTYWGITRRLHNNVKGIAEWCEKTLDPVFDSPVFEDLNKEHEINLTNSYL